MKCSIHFWRSPCIVQCGLPNLCEFLLSKGALCRHLFLASKRSWQFRWGRSERWWTFLLPFTNQVLPGLVILNRLEQVLKKQSKNWGSAHSNQIYLSTFMCLTVDKSFIFTENQMFWNGFLISVSLRWHSGIKNHEIWMFKVNFLYQKMSESF